MSDRVGQVTHWCKYHLWQMYGEEKWCDGCRQVRRWEAEDRESDQE